MILLCSSHSYVTNFNLYILSQFTWYVVSKFIMHSILIFRVSKILKSDISHAWALSQILIYLFICIFFLRKIYLFVFSVVYSVAIDFFLQQKVVNSSLWSLALISISIVWIQWLFLELLHRSMDHNLQIKTKFTISSYDE